MANLPTFARGTLEKIYLAVETGILPYPSYAYVTDTKQLAFVDKDLSVNIINGNNPVGTFIIKKVDVLPDVSEAHEDTLYIYNYVIYMFVDGVYKPLGVNAEEISEIKKRLDYLEEYMENIHSIPTEDIIKLFKD